MTVSSQTNNETFDGNGATTVWDLPFRFFDDNDVFVYLLDPATGTVTPLALGTDYTLIGAGFPEQFGVSQSQIITTDPVASGLKLYVDRVMQLEQLIDIINQGRFFPEVHEEVFDRLTMLIQQVGADAKGSIRVALADPEPTRLPNAILRANLLMGFDSLGNPIAVSPSSGSAAGLALLLANASNVSQGAAMIGRGNQVVKSIAELRTLLNGTPSKYAFATGYYAPGDGGGGPYWLDMADTTSADNGGSIIVAADGGRWKLQWSGVLSVKQFGAKGDYSFDTFTGSDDTAALQDCANALQATGGEMYHPPGSYQVTAQVEIVQPGTSDFVRVSVTGAGSGASQIVSNGNITAYRFTGTAGSGIHSYQHIQGLHFRAVGGTFIGTALRVDNFAYGEFNDVLAENFEYGLNGTDMLSSLFIRCQFRGNNFGNNLAFSDSSRPNAITYLACVFTANKTWGIVAGSPSAITMLGGSVEGNGTDTGTPSRGGVLMIGAGTEGAVGINASGVYFEGNGGLADFYCTSSGTDGQVAHSFTGCTFNRISDTQFVTNNIHIDGVSKAALSVHGCGFKHFNSYVPNAARKYIDLVFADLSKIDFSESGNFYASDSERPFVAGQQIGQRASASAFVRFDGGVGGATLVQSYNVASVTRLGVGVYQVNYQRHMNLAQNIYAFTANGTGFRFESAEATSSVTVTFTDSAGTPVDALGCSVTVFGQPA